MLVVSPKCFGLVVRGRRKALKLRQAELANAAGVGRDWIIDLEAGREGLDFSRVLRVFQTLDIELSAYFCKDPPAWTIPFTQDAAIRERRLANLRPRRSPRPAATTEAPRVPS